MQKAYNRTNWENDITPLNEDNLNNIEAFCDEVDNRVITLDLTKLDKTSASGMITGFALNTETGVITLTYYDGSKKNINTNLAKIALNISYDAENERLVLTMPDGSVTYVDMSALITQYEFVDSDIIYFEVTADGKVKASIKANSITADKLQPNFLADVQTAASEASASVTAAANSATAAATSEANAKASEDAAKQAAQTAQEVTGITYASEERAGLVKPKDVYVNQEDGSMEFTARTDSGLLEHSHAGGIRLHSITAVEDRQESTTGAQLCNVRIGDAGAYGLTAKETVDGDISISGQSSDAWLSLCTTMLVAGETYTLSTAYSAARLVIWDSVDNKELVLKQSGISSLTFSATNTGRHVIVLHIITDMTFNGTIMSIMLNAGTEALPWEQYTGRKASPCPGEKAITSNNHLEVTLAEQTTGGLDIALIDVAGVHVSGDATEDVSIIVGTATLDAGTYYASVSVDDNTEISASGSYVVGIYEEDNLVDAIAILSDVGEVAFTLAEGKTVVYEIYVLSGNAIDSVFYPMISVTSGATWDVYAEGHTEGYPQAIEGTVMKNFLDCRGLSEKTANGGTFTPVCDSNGNLQYVNVNGTFTAQTDYYLLGASDTYAPLGAIKGERYILSGKANTNIRWRVSNETKSVDANVSTESLEFTYDGNMYILLRVAANSTFANEKIYPMIRPASILDDTYVPFGCLRVKGVGEQLIKYPFRETTKTANGITFTDNGDGTITVKGTATASAFFSLYNSSNGIISEPCFVSGSNGGVRVYAVGTDGQQYMDKGEGIELPNGFKSASVYVASGTTLSNVTVKPMINYGTEARPWRPYTEQSTILTKQFAEFHNIGGISDGLTTKAEVRRFATVVLDGSDNEGWYKENYSADNWRFMTSVISGKVMRPATANTKANMLCDSLKVRSANGTYLGNTGISIELTGLVSVSALTFTSFADWKAYFSAHPITVVYELAEPEYTDLPTADQIALHRLMSYDGVTHLQTDTYPPMVIECEYGTSKVGAEMIAAGNKGTRAEIEVAALKQAILSMGGNI